MTNSRTRFEAAALGLAAIIVTLLACSTPVIAQTFPAKPITVIVPWPAGGSQLDQVLWYQSSEDYAKFARDTSAQDRALIARLGLLAK